MPRCIDLQGGCNFRDLGGYVTADGRMVRYGALYRSGVLTYFTPRDFGVLTDLNVLTLCDLRRTDERKNERTHWPEIESVNVQNWDDPLDRRPTFKFEGLDSAKTARTAMINLYRSMPEWLGFRLTGVFRSLYMGKFPLVFHCSAGKDRTGFVAALVLSALGVPKDVILADYLYTNEVVDLEAFIRGHRQATLGLANLKHPILQLPREARIPLTTADPAYLNAALEIAEDEYGSLDEYLQQVAGITTEKRARMRDLLLDD